jgi:hypothetical protein
MRLHVDAPGEFSARSPRATCYVPSAACGRATCDVLRAECGVRTCHVRCALCPTCPCDVLCARRATCDVLRTTPRCCDDDPAQNGLSGFVGKLLEEQDGDVLREGIRVLSQAQSDRMRSQGRPLARSAASMRRQARSEDRAPQSQPSVVSREGPRIALGRTSHLARRTSHVHVGTSHVAPSTLHAHVARRTWHVGTSHVAPSTLHAHVARRTWHVGTLHPARST